MGQKLKRLFDYFEVFYKAFPFYNLCQEKFLKTQTKQNKKPKNSQNNQEREPANKPNQTIRPNKMM